LPSLFMRQGCLLSLILKVFGQNLYFLLHFNALKIVCEMRPWGRNFSLKKFAIDDNDKIYLWENFSTGEKKGDDKALCLGLFSCYLGHNECDPPSGKTIHLQPGWVGEKWFLPFFSAPIFRRDETLVSFGSRCCSRE